jgi:hypothetical protein
VGALAVGYTRVEVFGADDPFQRTAVIRITDLREKESLKATLPMSRGGPPVRLCLVW